MPSWEGIEDASASPCRVWLSREKETDDWKPLRKVDCRALNDSPDAPLLIDGGRATADPVHGIIHYNFIRAAALSLTSATWFIKEEKSSKVFTLVPIQSEKDTQVVEELYQRAIASTTSFGDGIDSLLKEEVPLVDEEEQYVTIVKTGTSLTMKKKLKGWFGASVELQRGYGAYTVPGEDIEEALGPVQHLAFLVHGIGESLWSRDDIKMPGLVEQSNYIRFEMQKRQYDLWKKQCEKAKKTGNPEPDPPKRVEIIPIEWYDKIHNSSNALMKSLKACTLPTIPGLRILGNDVVFDVLMYLTPEFSEAVLECVTNQIEEMYHHFLKIHEQFLERGGKFSLIGHSLGSVVVWDLLSILKEVSESGQTGPASQTAYHESAVTGVPIASPDKGGKGYQAYALKEHANQAKNGTWGPSFTKPMKKAIPFEPEYTLFWGSPLGMFLTLRGAHAVFDEMRQNDLTEDGDPPLISPFTLPSKTIYNIFHPSDPVAYRIEPLLLPQQPEDPDAEKSTVTPPEAMYLTTQQRGVRLHVKARQILGGELSRSIQEQASTWTNIFATVAESLSKAAENDEATSKRLKSNHSQDGKKPKWHFPLGGNSYRVDYQLQPGVIDNEYISAVTAHSSYFSNPDMLDFLIDIMATEAENQLVLA